MKYTRLRHFSILMLVLVFFAAMAAGAVWAESSGDPGDGSAVGASADAGAAGDTMADILDAFSAADLAGSETGGGFGYDPTANQAQPDQVLLTRQQPNTNWVQPSITLTKSVFPDKGAAIGEQIRYDYRIQNNGTVEVRLLTLSDDKLGIIELDQNVLAPGEIAEGSAFYTISACDLPGPIVNTAVAQGFYCYDGGSIPTTATATISIPVIGNAAIKVTKTADKQQVQVGDTINYQFEIQNTGTVELNSVTLVDNKLGLITLSTNQLAPGAATSAAFSYLVSANDVPGPIVNTATATGYYCNQPVQSVASTAVCSVSILFEGQPAISVKKLSDLTVATVGETVQYSFTVTNTGTVSLTAITLVDDRLGAIDLDKTFLLPGETAHGAASYTVVAGDYPGSIVNTATATGVFQDQTVSAQDSVTVEVSLTPGQPAIFVSKTADQPQAQVGETVVYTYTVKNTGEVPVTNVSLIDDKLGAIVLDKTSLLPGEQAVGSASYVVQAGDVPGVTNVAVATAYYNQTELNGEATVTVPVNDSTPGGPALALTKQADRTSALVSETVTYTYQVTNSGAVALEAVALNDDKLGAIVLDKTELAPGETATGSATYTVVCTDLPGPLVNTAVATASYENQTVTSEPASASVTMSSSVSLEVTKTPSVATAKPGDTISYSYTVKNTGTEAVTQVVLSDNKLDLITLDKTDLAPGEQAIGSATYTVLDSDLPGPLTNQATATADYCNTTVSASASANVELSSGGGNGGNGGGGTNKPALTITKQADKTSAQVSETVTYSYTVQNTGQVALTAVALNDDKLGAIVLDKTELAPGETATGSATYTVVCTDLPGPLVNTAVATASYENQTVTSEPASASVTMSSVVSLEVTKTASAMSAKAGDEITYTYTVTNSGTVTVAALALNDDKLGAIALDKSELAPGEQATGSATYTVLESDLSGPLTNLATATAEYCDTTISTTASASVTTGNGNGGGGGGGSQEGTPGLTVTKTPDRLNAAVGDTVKYTYVVKNTGTVNLTSLMLTDDKLGVITLDKTELAPGEQATGTASYTVKTSDLPGPLVNIAVGTAASPKGPADGTAESTVYLLPEGGGGGGDNGGGDNGDGTGGGDNGDNGGNDGNDGNDGIGGGDNGENDGIGGGDEQQPVNPPSEPPATITPPAESTTPQPPAPESAPSAPQPELPYTGGNPLLFVSAGLILAGLGTYLKRYHRRS